MSVLQIFRGDEFLEEVVLARAVMGLGRHPQNDIVLDDRSLSRFHARVERRGDRFVVVDCGAQNGVQLNGERVVGESSLAPGDRITLRLSAGRGDVAGNLDQRLGIESVAFLQPVRHIDIDLGPKQAQTLQQDGRSSHAIDVVIAVDADALPGPDSGQQAVDGSGHPRQEVGAVQTAQRGRQEALGNVRDH